MNPTKQNYIEQLEKVLKLFSRIDLEEYEQVLEDDESPGVVSGTLKRMIKDIQESDDEAWGHERPDRGE